MSLISVVENQLVMEGDFTLANLQTLPLPSLHGEAFSAIDAQKIEKIDSVGIAYLLECCKLSPYSAPMSVVHASEHLRRLADLYGLIDAELLTFT